MFGYIYSAMIHPEILLSLPLANEALPSMTANVLAAIPTKAKPDYGWVTVALGVGWALYVIANLLVVMCCRVPATEFKRCDRGEPLR